MSSLEVEDLYLLAGFLLFASLFALVVRYYFKKYTTLRKNYERVLEVNT